MVGSGERGGIQRGEFASEIPVVARHGHHGCVVGAVGKSRDVGQQIALVCHGLKSLPQSAVGRDAPAEPKRGGAALQYRLV